MGSAVAPGFRALKIPKRLDRLIAFFRNGMVLAIPLTQAAVGAVRSVKRLRQGDDTSCLLN
jgi:hypothetical protein